jgi:uncharacterized membrane protein YgaE (UPF0421/DUF939 family)
MSAFRDFFTPKNIAGNKVTLRDVTNAPYFRLAVLSSLAATTAYFIGANSTMISGTTAAITTLVSVRHTFHDSIRESFTQIIGVLIGGTVAFVSIQLIGFNSFVVLFAVFSCFITARLLKLGEEGAIALGITLILVMGPRTSSGAIETIEQRFFGVLLGVALAIFVSYFVRKGSPHSRALKAGIDQALAMAALLHKISDKLSSEAGQITPTQAVLWLAKAERISEELLEIKAQALSAVEGSGWSPIIDRRDAEAVLKQIEMNEATAATVVSICRELVLTFGKSEKIPTGLASALAGVLSATADVISEQAEVAEIAPATSADEDDVAFDEMRDEAIKELRGLDETQPLLIGGSILRDAEKINDLLT